MLVSPVQWPSVLPKSVLQIPPTWISNTSARAVSGIASERATTSGRDFVIASDPRKLRERFQRNGREFPSPSPTPGGPPRPAGDSTRKRTHLEIAIPCEV